MAVPVLCEPASGTGQLIPSQTCAALVRYATLAASSHNTQPWRFEIAPVGLAIFPDFGRRCPVVDPDDHHLFVSLGCATENLLIAGQAIGLQGCVAFEPATVAAQIHVSFEKTSPQQSLLFDAIERRQCTRSEYDGRAVTPEDLKSLELSGSSDRGHVVLITDKTAMNEIGDFVAEGNATQLADERFLNELLQWVRFNRTDAGRAGDGLFGPSVGLPEVPRWLGKAIMKNMLSIRRHTERDVKHIRSSAGIAVFVSNEDDRAHWIDAGRRYQRVALHATALGVRNAFINQPLEVPRLRSQLAAYLGLGAQRPNLLIRFGHGREMPRSFRRAVSDVLH